MKLIVNLSNKVARSYLSLSLAYGSDAHYNQVHFLRLSPILLLTFMHFYAMLIEPEFCM
jgi:hypothetical protein